MPVIFAPATCGAPKWRTTRAGAPTASEWSGMLRVTTEFARTHRQVRDQGLDRNFLELLVEMERTFAEQRRALVERDLLLLDVDIEVLHARLTRDGPG